MVVQRCVGARRTLARAGCRWESCKSNEGVAKRREVCDAAGQDQEGRMGGRKKRVAHHYIKQRIYLMRVGAYLCRESEPWKRLMGELHVEWRDGEEGRGVQIVKIKRGGGRASYIL